MARDVMGLCDCPECGCERAEIKPQKNGLAYRWCPECFAQYFPKKTPPSEALLNKARPGTATGRFAPVPEPEPEREPAPVPVPQPILPDPPAPKARRQSIDIF